MLDNGYWMLDNGCWIMDNGYWMLDTGISDMELSNCSRNVYQIEIRSLLRGPDFY